MVWEHGQMVDRYPREGYGYGIIRMTHNLTRHIAPLARIELTDTMGYLKEQGVFDQLKAGLCLPEDYTIHGVYLEPLRRTWCILIEALGVPTPDEGEMLPVLTPIYEHRYHFAVERIRDGKPPYEVKLLRVDVATDPYMALRID